MLSSNKNLEGYSSTIVKVEFVVILQAMFLKQRLQLVLMLEYFLSKHGS